MPFIDPMWNESRTNVLFESGVSSVGSAWRRSSAKKSIRMATVMCTRNPGGEARVIREGAGEPDIFRPSLPP